MRWRPAAGAMRWLLLLARQTAHQEELRVRLHAAEACEAVREAEEGGDGGDVPDVLVVEAVGVQRREIAVVDLVRSLADFRREREHRALARRDVSLAPVDGHLVGHQRLL